jgi:hypothetical protein
MLRLSFVLFCWILISAAAGWSSEAKAAVPESFFKRKDVFFKAHVREGLFDYGAVTAQEKAALSSLLQAVGQADLKQASPAVKKAFYINAYNLLVVGAVVERYPLPSVKEVPGFFDQRTFAVAGERLTLNDLENKRLREPFQDPRIHFVLVCAARGCPPLIPGAYVPETLEKQLSEQTRRAFDDASFVRVVQPKKQVLVSEIFNWYAPDFPAGPKGVISFLNTYRSAPVPAGFQVGYYPYDWALNDTRRNR